MILDALRSLWAEPRVLPPRRRAWWDWVVVAVAVPAALLEGLLLDDLSWRPVAIAHTVVLAFVVPWRRSDPFAAFAAAFGATLVLSVASVVAGVDTGLGSSAYMLLFAYSLFRWASGREVAFGAVTMVVIYALSLFTAIEGVDEFIGGLVVFEFPAVLGATVRFRANARMRALDQVKLLEREQLARELHDTVAHHVSAIAIQAQAGRALAASNPAGAVDVLAVIEEAASRTLVDLRTIVGALRDPAANSADWPEPNGDSVPLAPQPGLADIVRLADTLPNDGPKVDVELAGDLTDLPPLVGAALYRMAQESITNGVRHARQATSIMVRVVGEADDVRLTVSDDGEPVGRDGPASGYGLVGMTERATLLGGTLVAGPGPERGWTVEAVLPRSSSPP